MKNTLKDKMESRQYRLMEPFEVKVDDEEETDYLVEGYAMKFAPYPLYETDDGIVYEQFNRGAFNDTDLSDIIFLYDHQGKVFARGSNGTLRITFDDIGMKIQADLSKSRAAKEMYDEIQAGLVTKMSWGFRVGDYYFDDRTRTIVHNSIKKVYDVSAVGIPANNDTVINARKFVNGVIDEFEAERLEVQKEKDKLILELELAKK